MMPSDRSVVDTAPEMYSRVISLMNMGYPQMKSHGSSITNDGDISKTRYIAIVYNFTGRGQ